MRVDFRPSNNGQDNQPVDSREPTAFQSETVALFTRAARALSLPKSIGQIYGLLYATRDPLSLDEVAALLGMSKGSVSQGLRWLRQLGAIRADYRHPGRRDRYTAEVELRLLAVGFLRGTAEPHLRGSQGHLDRLDEIRRQLQPGEEQQFSADRVSKLRRWNKFAHKILPLVLKVSEKF